VVKDGGVVERFAVLRILHANVEALLSFAGPLLIAEIIEEGRDRIAGHGNPAAIALDRLGEAEARRLLVHDSWVFALLSFISRLSESESVLIFASVSAVGEGSVDRLIISAKNIEASLILSTIQGIFSIFNLLSLFDLPGFGIVLPA